MGCVCVSCVCVYVCGVCVCGVCMCLELFLYAISRPVILQRFKPAYRTGYRIAAVSNIIRFFMKLFNSDGKRCSNCGVCEVSRLLGCDTLLIVKYFPTFPKILYLLRLGLIRPKKKSFPIDIASYLRRLRMLSLIFGYTFMRCICDDMLRDT